MHPAVESGEIGEIAERAQRAKRERIKQADFNIRMGIQQPQRAVHAHRIVIIQQNTHPHAAPRRRQQCAKQQPPGHIVFPDIVLDVDSLLRHLRQQVAGGEGVEAVIKRM